MPPGEPEPNAQGTEDYLRKVTVGEFKSLNRSVTLVEYDPAWPRSFALQEKRIRSALGAKALTTEHVGSTSVRGLVAKPTIDILLVVADSADEAAYVPPLEAAGYVLRVREPEWYQHRLFRSPKVPINLHVFSAGCEEVGRVLKFRDRLRENVGDRELYAKTKRDLAARTWKFTQNYADAKSEVIRSILARADS
jgi:GrpB-like predicted nucleotidyltransferase (UPF0157 family)